MGKTITQKIIETHLVSGRFDPGEEVALRVDQTLTQDATGTMAYLHLEAMKIDGVKTELSVSYIDHNTTQIGFENADDHRYLLSVARRYGVYFSRAGNGICHQVHLERFGRPGKTLLGSDSHTSTAGALGMLAVGAGGLDVALAMAGEPFYFDCPRVIRINLTGKLAPWVSAKDIILRVLEIFTTKGNVGYVFEYGGDGLSTLSVPERATIANMGAECGVTTSIFPGDEMTRRFLRAEGREKDWSEIKPDADALYEKTVEINLSEIVPMMARPHSPDNVDPVAKAGGIPVSQVCIGSCTNSSYKDLVTVAKILRGKHVHEGVSLVVTPGSRQVLENLTKDGYLADFLGAGARLTESACGFCIGASHSPESGGVSVRTSNRNFPGRSGTADAEVYLTSPETAAAAALTGRLIDPRNMPLPCPGAEAPERFYVSDDMIVKPIPAAERASVRIIRGPNIGKPPENDPLPADISGEAAIKVGDQITTDHIMPAGPRMKYRSNIPKYAEFVFESLDKKFYRRAMKNRKAGKHNIIIAGLSYGQGSSREHAALCPMYLGVKAVIAKSFERIHAANLINFGILPLTFKDEKAYDGIEQGDRLDIPGIRKILEAGGAIMVRNTTRGLHFEAACSLSRRQRDILLAGGALNLAKKKRLE
ncbi:MAG TPA: aconitate hydratase [Syntrophales bacterium]|nr:aconitate hydratase [Syntrophales bacterium]HOX94313.1 aconitate hydratase [Syntrophales bacterium]HPI56166.1 aconitate hydratase [Syntrophales bacterium]HPN24354.1 aconitate hydratase [Syntrophales bacterium]HQM28984.1 aconitate hydratase [Syntrophales bacterium]